MRPYVIATGVIFALLTVVHVWRIVEEPNLAREPWFILVTLVAAAFAVGAWRLSTKQPHQ
jgi:hypothetical protein